MQIKVAGPAAAAPPMTTTRRPCRPRFIDRVHHGAGRLRRQGQDPIIVGQTAYNSTYNTTFPATRGRTGASRESPNLASASSRPDGTIVSNFPMKPKAIHDEMGATFDDYGRMSAKLGLEVPFANAAIANFVLQNYVDPPTEIVKDGRDPDLEDHPQRRGHAPHPLPPLRRAGAQPGRLGRVYQAARSQRAGLEGHRQDKPAGGHHRRLEAGESHLCPSRSRTAFVR